MLFTTKYTHNHALSCYKCRGYQIVIFHLATPDQYPARALCSYIAMCHIFVMYATVSCIRDRDANVPVHDIKVGEVGGGGGGGGGKAGSKFNVTMMPSSLHIIN